MFYNAKNGSIDLGEARMDYVTFGRGSQSLVLLPGLGDGLRSVRGMALSLAVMYRRFCRDFRVYVFSRSDPLPKSCSISGMAEAQAAAMAALGISRACVMGISQGSMIAQRLALAHPSLVDKLVLAATMPEAGPVLREALEHWLELARQGDYKALLIDTAERSYSQARLRKYRPLYPLLCRLGRPDDPERFITQARACMEHSAKGLLCRISCPVLVIGGEADLVAGKGALAETAAEIPGCRLELYPELGHGAYDEAPDFNSRVLAFLLEK